MVMVTNRRRTRWAAPAVAVLVALAGCTTNTPGPPTEATPAASGTVTTASSTAADTSGSVTSDAPATEAPPVSTSSVSTSSVSTRTEPTDPTPNTPTVAPTLVTYSTPADAESTEGDCPYLTKDQVQADTGQRMGPTRIRSATPAPVCEFVRNDGGFLATVRVLQLAGDADAVAAVDFYVPRDTSNPETRPAGWTGGSVATDGGSTYGVSKGTYAVIATTNQKQSVYARLLVVHAIEGLGL